MSNFVIVARGQLLVSTHESLNFALAFNSLYKYGKVKLQ